MRSDHFRVDLPIGRKHSNPEFSNNIVAYFSLPDLASIANQGHCRSVMPMTVPPDTLPPLESQLMDATFAEAIFPCVASSREDVSDDARKSVHARTIFESNQVSNPVHTLMLDEVNPLRAAPLRNSAQSPTKSASYTRYIAAVNFLVDATQQ